MNSTNEVEIKYFDPGIFFLQLPPEFGRLMQIIHHLMHILHHLTQKGVNQMLEILLGSASCEQVLLFILVREEGYPREIARFFGVDYRPIRNQLDKLESGGILRNRSAGRTRLYSFNPRCPFLNELKILLAKVMTFCPEDIKEKLLMNRRRPRRRGKPL